MRDRSDDSWRQAKEKAALPIKIFGPDLKRGDAKTADASKKTGHFCNNVILKDLDRGALHDVWNSLNLKELDRGEVGRSVYVCGRGRGLDEMCRGVARIYFLWNDMNLKDLAGARRGAIEDSLASA
jgi:hypothetical protein